MIVICAFAVTFILHICIINFVTFSLLLSRHHCLTDNQFVQAIPFHLLIDLLNYISSNRGDIKINITIRAHITLEALKSLRAFNTLTR